MQGDRLDWSLRYSVRQWGSLAASSSADLSCRYFREVVDYVTRQDTLTHMVRAWLKMTAAEDIETWIAHGTLLGWWWNGKVRVLTKRMRQGGG